MSQLKFAFFFNLYGTLLLNPTFLTRSLQSVLIMLHDWTVHFQLVSEKNQHSYAYIIFSSTCTVCTSVYLDNRGSIFVLQLTKN